MSETAEMTTRALAPWFGAARTIATAVGDELRGCSWVGVPFAGGMSELSQISATTLVVSDKHRHIINLASIVATQRRELVTVLRSLPFHPDVLKAAQEFCKSREPNGMRDFEAALHYFICVWMGRSHKAGTSDEFNGGLSRRWNSNGGDSNTRYRSALRSLAAWGSIMRRCSFDVMDCFDFIPLCKDEEGHGVYVDPPWPDDGAKYRHKFTNDDHVRLRDMLARFKAARVVIRYGDHPLIRSLYGDRRWTWRNLEGRTQTNKAKAEVLILNGPSNAPRSRDSLFG